jgi:hypothetical protein
MKLELENELCAAQAWLHNTTIAAAMLDVSHLSWYCCLHAPIMLHVSSHWFCVLHYCGDPLQHAAIQANKVSCVGVISHAHGGGLVGSLSSSDLAGLLPEHFVLLAGPVLQYLTARSSAGWGGQQHTAAAATAGPPALHALQQQQQQQSVGGAHAWGLKVGSAV